MSRRDEMTRRINPADMPVAIRAIRKDDLQTKGGHAALQNERNARKALQGSNAQLREEVHRLTAEVKTKDQLIRVLLDRLEGRAEQ